MPFGRRILILLTILCSCLPFPALCKKTSLFELVEQVTELSAETFGRQADSKTAWVIDFYSPMCPHCVRFKPTWEKVGTALRDSNVRVGAVNCVKHRELCKSIPVLNYPTLVALNSPSGPRGRGTAAEPATKVIETGSHKYESIMNLIEDEFLSVLQGDEGLANDLAVARALEQDAPIFGDGMTQVARGGAPCKLRIEDATVSIRFALRNEVFTQGHKLDEERMGALVSFLELLATTFPGAINRASFRGLATELRRDPGLNDIARWDKRIGNFDIGPYAPTKEDNWPAANIERGTEAGVPNYTSGLWSLFHALSVSSAPMRQHPYAVMEGIRSFVDNFFRCEHCRRHFLEMYATCDNGRCNISKPSNMRSQHISEGESALALWVWRMHNAVNTRLALEGDDDIDPHKSLWPSATICKECWSGFPQEREQPSWSETEVLKFLKGTFSCPEEVGEGPDSTARSWVVNCVLVCTLASVVMWARKWVEMRGVGLTKKRDALPGL
ncbi:unnamed protein product [Scytosiphon promiscuus]